MSRNCNSQSGTLILGNKAIRLRTRNVFSKKALNIVAKMLMTNIVADKSTDNVKPRSIC